MMLELYLLIAIVYSVYYTFTLKIFASLLVKLVEKFVPKEKLDVLGKQISYQGISMAILIVAFLILLALMFLCIKYGFQWVIYVLCLIGIFGTLISNLKKEKPLNK